MVRVSTPKSLPLTYHVGGDLFLPDPASCGVSGPLLELARELEPALERLDARDLSRVPKTISDIDDEFVKFKTLELKAWLSCSENAPEEAFLVKPSGSLQSPIAHHLHQPSFATSHQKNGGTADPTNGCIAMVMGNAFEKGKTLIFDHLLRRHEKSEGFRNYPEPVIQQHETMVRKIRESMEAKVEVVYGSKVQNRMNQTLQFHVLPLWGEFEDIFICLEMEANYGNAQKGEEYRRLIVCAAHPQRLFYEKVRGPTAVRQDKLLTVAARIARVPYVPDYFQEKVWRKHQLFQNSKSMAGHWSTTLPEGSFSDPPERDAKQLLSGKEGELFPTSKVLVDSDLWGSFFDRKPLSNKELRDILPKCLETARLRASGQWSDPSDFPEIIKAWWSGQKDILFRDTFISGVADFIPVCRRLDGKALKPNASLNSIVLSLIEHQVREMSRVPKVKIDHLVYSGFAPFNIVEVQCAICGHKRTDAYASWSVNRSLHYVLRGFRCPSASCKGRQTSFYPVDLSVLSTRKDPASLTTKAVFVNNVWYNCLRDKAKSEEKFSKPVECWCIVCRENTKLSGGRIRLLDEEPRWTIGDARPLYLERDPSCQSCKANGDTHCRRFIPVDPSIPSITRNRLAMFEENFGNRFQPAIKARILETLRPCSREHRRLKIGGEGKVDAEKL